MSSKLYKKYVKEKVNKSAFEYLISVQKSHSKIRSIKYSKLDMQPYMKSELFSKDNISLLFSLRSRTVRGIKSDFSEQFKPNFSCPLCSNHLDSLPEVLNCIRLKSKVQSLPEHIQNLITHKKYEDIFADVQKQAQATNTYTTLLKFREQLLDTTGPGAGVDLELEQTPEPRALGQGLTVLSNKSPALGPT